MSATDRLVSQPWDRQPGETAKAFAAFRRFLELGATRSLSKAAKAASRSVGLYKRWSRQWGWVERAAAWDGGQAREADRARQQLRQQLMERVVHDADQLRRLAMAKLGSLIVKDPVTGQVSPDPSVTPRDAVAVYRLHLDLLGMKGEGAAGPTADGEAGGSHLSGLSDEELRSYLEVLQERAGEPGGGEGR